MPRWYLYWIVHTHTLTCHRWLSGSRRCTWTPSAVGLFWWWSPSCWCKSLGFSQWNTISHRSPAKTTTQYIRHTPTHTHRHVLFAVGLYFSVLASYFRLVGSLHSRFSLNHKRNSINSAFQQDSHQSHVLTQYDTLTILRGCREPTYGCVTPQAAGFVKPPTSRTRSTPWKYGSENTSHLQHGQRKPPEWLAHIHMIHKLFL